VNTSHGIPPEPPRIDARIVELPPPKPVSAPPVAAAPPHSKAQPAQHLQKHAEPATAAQPIAQQITATPAQINAQTEPAPIQSAQQGSAATTGLPSTESHAAAQGINVRAGAIGVVEPQHQLDSPGTGNFAPADPTVYNEEAIVIIDGTPPSGGLWHQEYSGTCDPIYTWDQSCGMTYFSQPTAPWCYDADPLHPWIIGTCKQDLDKAVAAYKRKDYSNAYAIFKKLAEKEYAPAESDLAAMYAGGIGVAEDRQQAVFWWRKAAKENDPKAVYNMALAYSDGKGVSKDDKEAFYWYRKAAYLGFDFAQYNLAVMYALGKGIEKDDTQAAFWYRKSADRGNPDAEYNLGMMYASSAGVPKEEKESVYWYCKAMARSSRGALESLASMYAAGAEKPNYHEVAYACWLFVLPRRVPRIAELERTNIEKPLTPEQRTRAQNTARIWQSK
jgi:hypothetical protein